MYCTDITVADTRRITCIECAFIARHSLISYSDCNIPWNVVIVLFRVTTFLEFLETSKCPGILHRSGKRHKVSEKSGKVQGIWVVREFWLWHLGNMLVTELFPWKPNWSVLCGLLSCLKGSSLAFRVKTHWHHSCMMPYFTAFWVD